jgi:dinuclear metal center YbgI/SA1388 family protein
MTLIRDVLKCIETLAPPSLQESYDNAGLIVGNSSTEVKGVLVCLDSTEAVIEEAIRLGCNLVVAHHPIIFSGLKKLNGKNYVERTVIKAIQNNVAIYAAHTNLDNVQAGVNQRICQKLGLKNSRILAPKKNLLKKLVTFCPADHADKVRQALFDAGGGHIGKYDECSFNAEGTGTFRGQEGADPYVGQVGKPHRQPEIRMELIFEGHLESMLLAALRTSHPYEEVAYDVYPLDNIHQNTGSGMIGELEKGMEEKAFLVFLKNTMGAGCVRYSAHRADRKNRGCLRGRRKLPAGGCHPARRTGLCISRFQIPPVLRC